MEKTKGKTLKRSLIVGIIILFVGAIVTSAIETNLPLADFNFENSDSYKKLMDYNQQKNNTCNPSGIVWDKTFGGRLFDKGEFAEQTNDGGYIICGETCSYVPTGDDDDDAWLVKTDVYGTELWNKTYGGSKREGFFCVQQTIDGGYILTGYTSTFGVGSFDVWLVKTNASGIKEWDKTFGGLYWDYGVHVQQTSDGGYIIVGRTEKYSSPEDVWLIKTDSFGNLTWDKAFNLGTYEYGFCVQQTLDGGYILVGDIFSWGYPWATIAGWAIKTDSNGEMQWDKKFWYGTDDCKTKYVYQTLDEGYIIVGSTACFGNTGMDAWLIRLDENGSELWNRIYPEQYADEAYCVQQTSDGGYIFTGDVSGDLRLVKTDAMGNLEWDRRFGGSNGEGGLSVQQASDGGYIIGGYTRSYGAGYFDFWLLKTDENGCLNESNHRPEKPMPPKGITKGRVGIEYTFSSLTNDSDGDNVYYWFDWGDGNASGWIGPFSSGDTVKASHSWVTENGYKIQVKARDEHGKEGEWSDFLAVSMPRTWVSFSCLFLKFLEQFPNAFPILRYMLGFNQCK